MMEQLTINFTHKAENNPASQSYLDANRKHLNNQCQKVYDLLKRGVRLTVISAMNEYQVMSLPRRILDLEKALNITVKRECQNRIMTYYL